MGIKDINSTLKKHVPDAFFSVPLSKFSGKAVGIDASLWMFKSKSSSLKDVIKYMKDPTDIIDEKLIIEGMISLFYGFIYKLCKEGVTPVWIFDGPTHPEKLATEKRKKSKSKIRISLEEERLRLLEMDPLSRKPEMENFIRLILNSMSFTKNEESAIKNEIGLLGIPMFIAPNDAEIYASVLSRMQLLVGVWTVDTDTYASGALTTITGFSKGYSTEGLSVDIVLIPYVLEHFEITLDQFTDFCILHECDFNQRIPGLGTVSILNKMKEYKWNLNDFIKSEPSRDWDSLNVTSCREIFKGPDCNSVKITDLYIDRSKWINHMKNKSFNIEIPPNPEIVELVK